jgi:calcineurin-like phosphoesterase family protein
MIRGNHDQKDYLYYKFLGIELIENPSYIDENIGYSIIRFSHEPQEPNRNWDINIHGHIHNNDPHVDERDFEYDPKIHINISAEVMDYKPIRLGELLENYNS